MKKYIEIRIPIKDDSDLAKLRHIADELNEEIQDIINDACITYKGEFIDYFDQLNPVGITSTLHLGEE